MFAKARVSFEGSTGEGSASKLTQAAVGRIQFLPGYWSEASLSFLPHGPLHKAAHNMAVSCLLLEHATENNRGVPKVGALVFL